MKAMPATASAQRGALAARPETTPRPDTPSGRGVPARASGVELLGEVPGSGYRRPPALARRADGQTIQLTPLLYRVLEAVDGRRDHAAIAARVSAASGRLVSADNIRVLLDKLRPLGLLELADGSQPRLRKANPLLGLKFRVVLSNPRVTRRITAPFALLFQPIVVAAVVLAFVAAGYWVLFEKGLASAAYQALHQPGQLLLIVAITVASAGFHEFGHAAAARYGGATPGAMGAGLYLIWPAFYTDVTDSYRLGRGGRLRTDLGGLYFNAIVAVGMVGAWAATGWDALLLIIATQLLQMIRQLIPLVRFDGYHVLADLTGVPDLYQRIKPTLLGLLPKHRRNPAATALKPWARAVVTLWVVLVVPLLLLSLALLVVVLPRIVATAWESLGRQWALLHGAFGDGDAAAAGVRVLAIVAIALPLLGICYLLLRVVRRVTGGVWRATAGRPVHRAVAGITGAAILAALAWMWWPDGDTYRPIQPGERGTVADALGGTRPAATAHTPAVDGAAARPVATARTVWPADQPTPTREQPTLAVVLIPKASAGQPPAAAVGGAPAPTWVFPVDRPPAPRPGDNQALAVNTTDGSAVYEVAFALVWVTDGTADNRNEAYALANCRNCVTVAIAFQVVLIVGQADVVPENIAVALNYSCVECVTVALAKQLVLTVPGVPSEAVLAELAAAWARLAELGRNITELSLQQIMDELERIQSSIAEIIMRQPGAGSPGTGAGTSTQPVPTAPTAPTAPGAPTAPPSGPGATTSPPDSPPTTGAPTSQTPPSQTSPPPSSTTAPPTS